MGVVIKDGVVILRQGYFHGYTPFVWLIATMQVSKLLSISLHSSIIPNNTVKKKGYWRNYRGRNDEVRR